MPEQLTRQNQYFALIETLLQCPNGKEPEILDSHQDLLDKEFINTVMQVATYFAHHNNPDSAKFLIHIARELAKQLGFYNPSVPVGETP